MSNTIIDFLNKQAAASAAGNAHISFHMPGHKGRRGIFDKAGFAGFIDNIMACDITEIPGADALFDPASTIRAVMDNYADLYGVKHTELLVNGSSAGVMAAVMASVPIGGTLILGKNSHHSAFSALRLGAVNPVYVRPQINWEYGLTASIRPADIRAACDEHPEASAVLITSPNYYGMLSDIRAIADIAHDHGMLLIVDQAHGAHLRFFDYLAQQQRDGGQFVKKVRTSAEALGADIVVNSTHKTLLSFTGSGILNICSERADTDAVVRMLRMLQTTSPSYLAMGSLDINERIMREYGRSIMEHWKTDLASFYDRASRIHGLTVVDCAGMDRTKINISMASLGLSGDQLDRELRARDIIPEMVHGRYVMMMTGAGNRTGDYAALLVALRDISESYAAGAAGRASDIISQGSLALRSEPDFDLESADVPAEYESVPLYASEGCVLYDPVIIYPPGSPVVCPGEIMSMDAITYISDAISRDEKVTGVDDEGMVRVGAGTGHW